MITGRMKGWLSRCDLFGLEDTATCVSRGRMLVPSAVKEGCCCSSSSSYLVILEEVSSPSRGGAVLLLLRLLCLFFFCCAGLRGCVGFSLFAASRGALWGLQSRTRLKQSAAYQQCYGATPSCGCESAFQWLLAFWSTGSVAAGTQT